MLRKERRPYMPSLKPTELIDLYQNNAAADHYFAAANQATADQWSRLLMPLVGSYNHTAVADFACGRGRFTERLLGMSTQLVYAIDGSKDNLHRCMQRLLPDSRLRPIVNEPDSLRPLENEVVNLILSFDTLVHFDFDLLGTFLKEFRRVLKPEGVAICHYSNLENGSDDLRRNPHWRAVCGREHFPSLLQQAGLELVSERLLDWGDEKCLDVLAVVKRMV